jgi:hypothetical protein
MRGDRTPPITQDAPARSEPPQGASGSKPASSAPLSTDPPLARPYDEAAVCKINQVR